MNPDKTVVRQQGFYLFHRNLRNDSRQSKSISLDVIVHSLDIGNVINVNNYCLIFDFQGYGIASFCLPVLSIHPYQRFFHCVLKPRIEYGLMHEVNGIDIETFKCILGICGGEDYADVFRHFFCKLDSVMGIHLYIKKNYVRACILDTCHPLNRRSKALQFNIAESFTILLNDAQSDWFIIYCHTFNHDFNLI